MLSLLTSSKAIQMSFCSKFCVFAIRAFKNKSKTEFARAKVLHCLEPFCFVRRSECNIQCLWIKSVNKNSFLGERLWFWSWAGASFIYKIVSRGLIQFPCGIPFNKPVRSWTHHNFGSHYVTCKCCRYKPPTYFSSSSGGDCLTSWSTPTCVEQLRNNSHLSKIYDHTNRTSLFSTL